MRFSGCSGRRPCKRSWWLRSIIIRCLWKFHHVPFVFWTTVRITVTTPISCQQDEQCTSHTHAFPLTQIKVMSLATADTAIIYFIMNVWHYGFKNNHRVRVVDLPFRSLLQVVQKKKCRKMIMSLTRQKGFGCTLSGPWHYVAWANILISSYPGAITQANACCTHIRRFLLHIVYNAFHLYELILNPNALHTFKPPPTCNISYILQILYKIIINRSLFKVVALA